MEQSTTWTLTAIAAIAGLFICNLDSMGKLVSAEGLRWSLIFFTTSLVAGAISKQFGMAVTKGVSIAKDLEALLASKDGRALMDNMTIPPDQLFHEIAQPFWWPLSWMMNRGYKRSKTDGLDGDKTHVRLFCAQLSLLYLHGIFAGIGFFVIACSIKH